MILRGCIGRRADGRLCGRLIPATTANSRCPLHKRPSRQARGYGADYQRERAELIGEPCELRLPGCTGVADTADHVVPISRGGRDGPLRPACRHCNYRRGNR